MITDLILRSLTTALSNMVVPIGNIYFDRAEQPAGLDGFPYMRVFITNTEELTTQTAPNSSLVTYRILIEVFSCQSGSNDQIMDQGTIQRALESILNYLPPNTPWMYVTSFVHCLKQSSTMEKDSNLFQGKDVYKSTNVWHLLATE